MVNLTMQSNCNISSCCIGEEIDPFLLSFLGASEPNKIHRTHKQCMSSSYHTLFKAASVF